MEDNPLKTLNRLGQSVWLDYLSRSMLESGELRALVEEDGVSGVTSNPAIFEAAISEGVAYDRDIERLAKAGRDVAGIYRELTVADVGAAADLLKPVHERSGGRNGFVSLEVDPHLARDADGTLAEARDLWRALGRDNVLIKVPATEEALPVIRRLIAEGVNVNITLLFSLERYRAVREAWLAGLEERREAGKDLNVASVASFFLSRIDTLVDPLLARAGEDDPAATASRGRVAVAAAKLAYADYRQALEDERFRALADQGAAPQRLLWASTGTKNPDYSETHYIDPLVGEGTITTVPMQTLIAYRQKGKPRATLTENLDQARALLDSLPHWGVDLPAIERQLEQEGLKKFTDPHDKLLSALQLRGRTSVSG